MDPTPPRRSRLWDAWSPLQLAVFAVLLLGAQMFWQLAIHQLTGGVFVPVIVASLVAVVLPCAAASRWHGETLPRTFDLQPDRGALAAGAAAGLLAVAPASLLAGLSARLRPPGPDYLAFLAEQLPQDLAAALVALVAVAVAAPVAEELVFRGLLFRVARGRWGAGRAAVLTALFFGVAHWQPWSLFGLIGLGVLLALLYHWTGSLLAPIAAHAAHNTVSLALLLQARDGLAATGQLGDDPVAVGGGLLDGPAGWLLAAVSALLLWRLLRRLRGQADRPEPAP